MASEKNITNSYQAISRSRIPDPCYKNKVTNLSPLLRAEQRKNQNSVTKIDWADNEAGLSFLSAITEDSDSILMQITPSR